MAGEVVPYGPDGEAGLGGDVPECGLLDAAAGHDPEDGVHDVAAALLRIHYLRHPTFIARPCYHFFSTEMLKKLTLSPPSR
ncbi:hypothetical protein GCM10009680_43080 [Streptomyces yatensis]|uniref:Uncharacterized protein n=1 Tax=Streptomyces yatensis TaxID=155177 RepID=A0ABN2I443_9ACTN